MEKCVVIGCKNKALKGRFTVRGGYPSALCSKHFMRDAIGTKKEKITFLKKYRSGD